MHMIMKVKQWCCGGECVGHEWLCHLGFLPCSMHASLGAWATLTHTAKAKAPMHRQGTRALMLAHVGITDGSPILLAGAQCSSGLCCPRERVGQVNPSSLSLTPVGLGVNPKGLGFKPGS